ncbi:DUF2207 domain-containing protein [Desulfovibrio sp. OttesenSCG-928-I05]|nr:DUF2207 domain-containing protein [Desulfovibrio sp. OttesenSCG-928-I05]
MKNVLNRKRRACIAASFIVLALLGLCCWGGDARALSSKTARSNQVDQAGQIDPVGQTDVTVSSTQAAQSAQQSRPVMQTQPVRGPQSGRERILLFDVQAVFDLSGQMDITENITLQASGREIRRGFIRDLPLVWRRADGERYKLRYEVTGVSRNGKPEPYEIRREGDLFCIYLGDDTLLPHGEHTYSLNYRVSNHFSRFPEWDELYWNVTGNDWPFPIEKAGFSLAFRDAAGTVLDVPFRSVDLYTGKRGEKGGAARVQADKSISTTAALPRGAGLTVAYTWDRSVLAAAPDPQPYSPLRALLLPSRGTIAFWLIPLLQAGFLVYARRRLDPGSMPTVIPLFRAPEGLTPGALRQIMTKRYDGTAFSADMLELVAKGAARLENGKVPVLWRKDAESSRRSPVLQTELAKARDSLFAGGREGVSCGSTDRKVLIAVRERLASTRNKERRALFARKWPYLLVAFFMVFLLPLMASLWGYPFGDAVFFPLFLTVLCGVLIFLFAVTWRVLTEEGGAHIIVRGLLPLVQFGVTAYILILFISNMFSALTALNIPEGYVGVIAAGLLLCIAGMALLPGRTAEGLSRLAVARGLRMYLGAAEKDRFETLYPPTDSVENFEALLPYALALGVGKTWANRFERYLADTGQSGREFSNFSWRGVRSFQSSSSRYSVAPSSSSGGGRSGSGSRGGGFSGGGAGGGGGRGR